MEDAIRRLGTVNLRRIDIRDWNSPVAKQHKINSVPSLLLYDGDELLSDDTQTVIKMIIP